MKKENFVLHSDHFCGNAVSSYGLQNKRVDYACLSKCFDAVLNNNIMSATGFDYWELENGGIDNSEELEEVREKIEELEKELEEVKQTDFEEEEIKLDRIEELEQKIDILNDRIYELEEEENEIPEVYQSYIISESGANILKEYTNEIVWYNSELDLYLWGVTHFGTSWSYVLTNIQIELDK